MAPLLARGAVVHDARLGTQRARVPCAARGGRGRAVPPLRAAGDAAARGAASQRGGDKEERAEERDRYLNLLLRRHAVQPYPCRGECGSSRATAKLRAARRAAARDAAARHVLVIGEPGTLKSDIALLVHAGDSVRRRRPAAALDGGRLSDRVGATLICDLAEALSSSGGTLILRDVQALPADALTAVASAMSTSSGAHGVRLILTSSKPCAEIMPGGLNSAVITVRVPPLRVRRDDIEAEACYFLRLAASRAAQPYTMPRGITAAGVRQLQAHDWPGNEAELESLIERAAVQQLASEALLLKNSSTGVGGDATPAVWQKSLPPPPLSESVLWFNPRVSRGESFRFDLLRAYPLLRMFFRSDVWPEGVMRYVVVPGFFLVNLGLLLGPQARNDNVFLTVFWTWWWPGMLLLYPLVGRLWCSFCPFMAYGELVQRWRIAAGARLLKWPSDALERYGAWFLYALFAAILVWEEVWALEDHARLSSALLLLITAGAVVGSTFFEKRVWCRYLCPIGGMNGLYAKLALTEPRFIREAYAYLPLTWLGSLAHYLDLGMGEAGYVLPRAARTVGLTNLAEDGTLPVLAADPAVIDFCQGASVAGGSLLSLALLRALARRPWRALWPQAAAVALTTAQLWALVV